MQSKSTWFRLKDANILELLSHTQPPLYQDIKGILCWLGFLLYQPTQQNTTQLNLKTSQIYEEMLSVVWAQGGMTEESPVINFQRASQWPGQLTSDNRASPSLFTLNPFSLRYEKKN